MTNILELLKNEKVEWKKLGEVFDTRTGYTPSKKIKEYWKDGTVDWFTIDDIRKKGRNLKNANVKISEKGVKKELFKKNSLILSIIGTIGEYALIDTDFVINQQFMVFTLNENYIKSINMEFMKYYFSKVSEYCKNNIRQSSVPTIDTDGILRQEIPIPSLETQEKIVKILDKFTNYVMELQSELQSRTKQYTYYRDKLLSEDYLNKITKEMEEDRRLRVEKLKNICEFKRGKRLVKNELQEEGDFPVYQNSITPLGYYYEKNFDKDTTFIISAGAAGEIVYSDRDFWAADDVYVLLTREDIMSRYLYYCLMSKQYIIKSKVRKASIPRLSKDDIEKIIIPLPPLSLQNKIVKILDKFQILLVDTKGLLPEEIEQRQKQYEYYREKLLTFDEVSDRFDSIRFDSIHN
ncbi:MAG: restriction endonuclease subunit S [Gemella morbillorum]|uniref:restriction endonuclease subunit S n=1 Tax=Gemella morbillorum TaxID=29391 RepID=UPI001CAEC0E1|nr:restriction endonuclease subunit S [Gemella morbillorum]MBF1209903.1 restriction endonuclease subunit S [Gemella morbillorum]